ncbi:MAG: HU family DNA-binding protein [Deltaproteobacteria bacterium]|nr:HU family DNA-binding protein [Deltaproteobacteria bacterium]
MATKKKTTTKKVAKKKTGAADPAKKLAKITPAEKVRSKSQVVTALAERTGMSRKEVAVIVDSIGEIVKTDLGKSGPGMVKLFGLLKIRRVHKPKTPAGKRNIGGREVLVKAKPARNVVRVTALKALKEMV